MEYLWKLGFWLVLRLYALALAPFPPLSFLCFHLLLQNNQFYHLPVDNWILFICALFLFVSFYCNYFFFFTFHSFIFQTLSISFSAYIFFIVSFFGLFRFFFCWFLCFYWDCFQFGCFFFFFVGCRLLYYVLQILFKRTTEKILSASNAVWIKNTNTQTYTDSLCVCLCEYAPMVRHLRADTEQQINQNAVISQPKPNTHTHTLRNEQEKTNLSI